MTATDADIARRAGALCIVAEPHEDHTEWPCKAHLEEAKRQLNLPVSAVAPASSGVAPQPRTEGASGAAGPCAGTAARPGPAAPLQTENRPGLLTPRAAYRPNDLGQNGL